MIFDLGVERADIQRKGAKMQRHAKKKKMLKLFEGFFELLCGSLRLRAFAMEASRGP